VPKPTLPDLTIEPGTVLANAVTGELGLLVEHTPERVVAEVLARPGAAVAGAHHHPAQDEHFLVLDGVLGVRVGDERLELRAGEDATVPAGVVHDWWNAGDVPVHARITVTPPGGFLAMIGAVWGLAAQGRTDARGLPRPLDGALLLEAFGSEVVFERPPVAIQRAMAAVVAPVLRRLGRSVTDEALLRAAEVPAARWPLTRAA
jgi:mannose-6-phosphate isomerase-like protein (cupin superfamily)